MTAMQDESIGDYTDEDEYVGAPVDSLIRRLEENAPFGNSSGEANWAHNRLSQAAEELRPVVGDLDPEDLVRQVEEVTGMFMDALSNESVNVPDVFSNSTIDLAADLLSDPSSSGLVEFLERIRDEQSASPELAEAKERYDKVVRPKIHQLESLKDAASAGHRDITLEGADREAPGMDLSRGFVPGKG